MAQTAASRSPGELQIDRYRWFVFPNKVREVRRERGFSKLLSLSELLPAIPYIRLSKIERGEVFARVDELGAIAVCLKARAEDLLVDLDDPSFDLARWSEPFIDNGSFDEKEERFAILLAAALKARRAGDRGLTVSVLDSQYGIPPVMLSRIENAQKIFSRWNSGTAQAICAVMGVSDAAALRVYVEREFEAGSLAAYLPLIANAQTRLEKSKRRVAELRAQLRPETGGSSEVPAVSGHALAHSGRRAARLLQVYGVPASEGLIKNEAVAGVYVEAPSAAGPKAFGLRMCRATLGMALPAKSVLVVDPGVYPAAGGLAVLRVGEDYRVLSITFDRTGAMKGHSLFPEMEIDLAEKASVDLATVLTVSLI